MSDVMEAATSMESKGGNYPHRGFQSPGRRLPEFLRCYQLPFSVAEYHRLSGMKRFRKLLPVFVPSWWYRRYEWSI